jgi:hypothetical protein
VLAYLVEEGETGDQVVKAVGTIGHIVTEQFQGGKHGKTSVPAWIEKRIVGW